MKEDTIFEKILNVQFIKWQQNWLQKSKKERITCVFTTQQIRHHLTSITVTSTITMFINQELGPKIQISHHEF